MLKLEKRNKDKQVHVSLKDPRRLLTPHFLSAFAIASGIHLIGLLLFHVTAFKSGPILTIYPPTQVNIDFQPLIDGGVLAELEKKSFAPPTILPPEMSKPTISKLKDHPLNRELAYPRIQTINVYPFEKLDQMRYVNIFYPLAPAPKYKKHHNLIKISGALAESKLLNEKGIFKRNKNKDLTLPILTSFHVKVEERTGKIFWSEQIGGLEKKKIKTKATEILSKIRFEKNLKGFVKDGIIDIVIFIDEKEESA